jgi:phosphoribosylformylglycinamidine cyclo-ligase
MLKTLNCGIGMVLIVGAKDKEALIKFLKEEGESAFVVGEIVLRESLSLDQKNEEWIHDS